MGLTDAEKLTEIRRIIDIAESWCDEQLLPQSVVVLAALKDIRRIINLEA